MAPHPYPHPIEWWKAWASRRSSLGGLVCALFACLWSAAAHADARVVVELPENAAPSVSPKLVRRLVMLELAELAVPPPPDPAGREAPLYVRVVPGERAVRVELWQIGVHYGDRSVSVEGGSQLTARRIALASAELARRLRTRRDAEIAARQAVEQHREPPDAGDSIGLRARSTLAAGVRAAAIGPGDLWLIGPELRGGLWFSSGARLEITGSWLIGHGGDALGSARWLEIGLVPSYAFDVAPRWCVDLGIEAALAAAHLSGVRALDGETGRTDTWSARATVHARLELVVTDGLRISGGPDVGALLRPLRGADAGDRPFDAGGLWAGGSLAAVLDPSASVDRRHR